MIEACDCSRDIMQLVSFSHGRPLQQLTLSIDVVITLISLNKLCKTSTCTHRTFSSQDALRAHTNGFSRQDQVCNIL